MRRWTGPLRSRRCVLLRPREPSAAIERRLDAHRYHVGLVLGAAVGWSRRLEARPRLQPPGAGEIEAVVALPTARRSAPPSKGGLGGRGRALGPLLVHGGADRLPGPGSVLASCSVASSFSEIPDPRSSAPDSTPPRNTGFTFRQQLGTESSTSRTTLAACVRLLRLWGLPLSPGSRSLKFYADLLPRRLPPHLAAAELLGTWPKMTGPSGAELPSSVGPSARGQSSGSRSMPAPASRERGDRATLEGFRHVVFETAQSTAFFASVDAAALFVLACPSRAHRGYSGADLQHAASSSPHWRCARPGAAPEALVRERWRNPSTASSPSPAATAGTCSPRAESSTDPRCATTPLRGLGNAAVPRSLRRMGMYLDDLAELEFRHAGLGLPGPRRCARPFLGQPELRWSTRFPRGAEGRYTGAATTTSGGTDDYLPGNDACCGGGDDGRWWTRA